MTKGDRNAGIAGVAALSRALFTPSESSMPPALPYKHGSGLVLDTPVDDGSHHLDAHSDAGDDKMVAKLIGVADGKVIKLGIAGAGLTAGVVARLFAGIAKLLEAYGPDDESNSLENEADIDGLVAHCRCGDGQANAGCSAQTDGGTPCRQDRGGSAVCEAPMVPKLIFHPC